MTTTKKNPDIKDPRLIDPGDVLFFAPPVEAGNFDDFAQLAAYAQGAPWHHVAIASNRHNDVPHVIGFLFESNETAPGVNWLLAPIGEHPWPAATAGSAITALRAPTDLGTNIRDAALAQVGAAYYDLDGLLAFAAATSARMLVDAAVRAKAMQFAVGVEIARRANGRVAGHTCVSAVTRVLADAGVTLQLREPQPRPVPALAELDQIARVIELFLGKASAATSFGPLENFSSPLTLTEIEAGWGAPFGAEDPGGLVANTHDYLQIVAKVASGFRQDGYTSEELIRLGASSDIPADATPVDSWRTSPAMLHAALLEAGFTPVP